MKRAEPPLSTYRLQLVPGFGFAEAHAQIPYLQALGVGALYLSPIFEAELGSQHGYDVVDPTRVREELGGEAAFVALATAARDAGLGVVVDFVPNHMSVSSALNAEWWDVLENGKSSRFAEMFDIEWQPTKHALHDHILLPILQDSYGIVLERGELELVRKGGAFCLRYGDRFLPLAPRALGPLLRRLTIHDDEMLSIATSLGNLPDREETEPERREERAREKEIAKRRLATLCERADVRDAIDRELEHMNGTPNDPRSFDALDELISHQVYRLSDWRVALETINYRRFFDVNELAAIRVEDPTVFHRVHTKLFELIGRGLITGLRLDHVDGLRDPAGYLAALPPVWTVAEKILAEDEALPTWEVDGTTGYDFARVATGVLCNESNALDRIYRTLSGDMLSFEAHSVACKRLILEHSLASELQMLVLLLERMAEKDRRDRDLSLNALRQAITEVIAHFPVYRSYDPRSRHLSDALWRAQGANRTLSSRVFHFIGRAFENAEFLARFQQLTSPTMAKAIEDTAHYRYGRFLAMNEVGANPTYTGVALEEFHAFNAKRSHSTMNATSTHDTKRGEDARARLAVLSEMSGEWEAFATRWSKTGDEYVFLQTLVAALPFDFAGDWGSLSQRMRDYMRKAMREAKVHTSWVNQNPAYENAVDRFIIDALENEVFRTELLAFSAQMARAAASNALAQCVLKLCSPGVPDIYQGAELWEQSLVDPDNRRPVDFALRARALHETPPFSDWNDARVKQFVTRVCLHARKDFSKTGYEPIPLSQHVIAFRRGNHICAVTRFPWRLQSWGELALPVAGTCLFTGRTAQRLQDVFKELPVALLLVR